MPFFKVRDGHVCGIGGVDRQAGEIVELPTRIGLEVAEKLEPCTESGESLAHLSPEDLRVAQARAHERVSIREQQVEAARAALAAAEEALAAEKEEDRRRKAAEEAPIVAAPESPAEADEPEEPES